MKIILLLLLLAACSTTPPNGGYRKNATDENAKPEDDYNWINQLNFDKKTEVKYSADKDQFNVPSEESKHSLMKESLASLPPARLDEAVSKETDVLAKININCYKNKIDDGLKIADEIYEQYKNNTSYWNQLGTCFYLKADYAKAVLFYNKSRDLDSKFVPPVNNLGVVYGMQGKFQKALSAFKKATEVSLYGSTPIYNLAYLYLKFGIVEKALPIFQSLQRKSPQDVEVNSALALISLLKGDFGAAVQIYQTFDKDVLLKPNIGLNYAVALKLAGKSTEAQTAFGNVTGVVGLEMKEYTRKVEKFIRK